MASEYDLLQLVVGRRQGIQAGVAGDGRPELSCVLYLTGADSRVMRISTTSGLVKARNLARDTPPASR